MSRVPVDKKALKIGGGGTLTVAPGTRLHVYNFGTTTDATLYADDASATTLTPPLVADTEGKFNAWVDGGFLYDLYSPDDLLDGTVPWFAPGAGGGGGGAPTGPAGGKLAGSYPNPTLAAGAVGGTEVAAAIKDPAAGTAGLRTLGSGAAQAAAGNDSRLSDTRTPTDGSVSAAKLATGLLDIDGSLAANSDTKLVSQKAIRTYFNNQGIWPVVGISGVDPTGATDSRAGIQSVIDACFAAGGGTVLLGPGTFSIASAPGLKLKAGVKLRGAGMFQTVIRQDYNQTNAGALADSDAVIGTTGASYPTSLTTNVAATLNANANAGDATLTLVSTTGLVVDQYYMLGSDDRQFAGQTARRGEFVRIKSVDSATQVTLHGASRDNYTTANGAKLYTITWIEGVEISDLRVYNPNFDATTCMFIHLTACRNFVVERVLMVNGDTAGVRMVLCTNGKVDVVGRNFNDNNASGRNGYVTTVDGCTENVDINLNVRRARHAITCGPIANTPGLSRGIKVSGIVSEATAVAFDQHLAGADWVFENAHARNCSGWGFDTRSIGTKMIGCTTDFCDIGVNIEGGGTLGWGENFEAVSCIFKRTLNRTGTEGFAVVAGSNSTNAKRMRFIGCVFDGSARQLFMANNGDIRIIGCDFVNPGQGAGTRALDVASTASVYVDNCNFTAITSGATDDPFSTTNTPGVAAIRLSAGATGSIITGDNKQTGFTRLVDDSSGGGNTVQELVTAYTMTNVTTNRTLNADSYTTDALADVLGTLVADLKTKGILP